ncbi:MAG: universal stress protein, partial [Methylobacter sp.]
IDMTVMGAFGHTRIRDWLLGSFTVKMLTHSNKPLLLLR